MITIGDVTCIMIGSSVSGSVIVALGLVIVGIIVIAGVTYYVVQKR
jgi:hypothetical protein